MRINRLIPLVVSLTILAVITLTVIRLRSAEAQQARAARASIATSTTATLQTEADGMTSTPSADTPVQKDTDLYLDADEVERRAQAEQADTTASAIAVSKIPVSFKAIPIPLPGGIDHVVAGVGTRNSGQGVIRLRGVPPASTLLSALLVWGEIAAPPHPVIYNVGFGPDCAPGAIVGGTQFPNGPTTNCWAPPPAQTIAYIANVTAQIVPGINGDYRIRGLRSALTNNRCPWADSNCAGPGNALPLSQGASLIVLYSNTCIPRTAQLYMDLGPTNFAGFHTVTHAALPIPIRPNLPNLKHSRIGADGQVGVANCGLRAIPSVTDERTFILNSLGGAIQIKGDGGGLNRDSDWNGYDGEPLNKLWDSHTDVFANSNFLAVGGGLSYTVRYTAPLIGPIDCVTWMVHILGVR
ncbi:MAG TPA: hypothetical protein VJ810_27090 [Blastocatellia bacterium]|nr:hypothetical protein [Blastocatellia bacterium]